MEACCSCRLPQNLGIGQPAYQRRTQATPHSPSAGEVMVDQAEAEDQPLRDANSNPKNNRVVDQAEDFSLQVCLEALPHCRLEG